MSGAVCMKSFPKILEGKNVDEEYRRNRAICPHRWRALSLWFCRVIDSRQRKAQLYLQNFEESSNRKNKFSVSSTEEFCVAPDKLILQDASILALQDRLKRMDILYGIASKQFMQLEPEFEWKDQKDRKKEFYRILYSYNDLPQHSELDNIESELSWKSFCNW